MSLGQQSRSGGGSATMARRPQQHARVLVVQDDFSACAVLEGALKDEGYETESPYPGAAIEPLARRFRPDLALLDVQLRGRPDGYTLARRLREINDLAVLFLTEDSSVEARLAAFEAGADDYVIRPFCLPELLARVRAVLRRAGRLSSPVWKVGDLLFDQAAAVVMRAGELINLTPTEYRLLTLLAQHPGQVLSKEQLLDQAWAGEAWDTNLVEGQVSSLRRKLEAHGPRVVHTVRSLGYVLRTAP